MDSGAEVGVDEVGTMVWAPSALSSPEEPRTGTTAVIRAARTVAPAAIQAAC